MRSVVFPKDARLVNVFGQGLPSTDPKKRTVAYLQRLKRAITAGTLPKPVHISPRLWGWDEEELDAALAALPRDRSGFTPRAKTPAKVKAPRKRKARRP